LSYDSLWGSLTWEVWTYHTGIDWSTLASCVVPCYL